MTDAERFAPKADPTISLVSGGILIGFFIIQSRVNRSNELIEIIKGKKETYLRAKAALLSSDDPASALLKRDELQAEIERLEEELLNAMTFLDIPNGPTLRFRVLQGSDASLTERQKRELEVDRIKNAVIDMSSENNAETKTSDVNSESRDNVYKDDELDRGKLTVPSIESSTPIQRVLLFIGIILITSLSSLLVTLMSDPMTSTSSNYVVPSDAYEISTSPSLGQPQSQTSSDGSFKVREGVLESILREASQTQATSR